MAGTIVIVRLSQFNLTKFDCQLELSLAIMLNSFSTEAGTQAELENSIQWEGEEGGGGGSPILAYIFHELRDRGVGALMETSYIFLSSFIILIVMIFVIFLFIWDDGH